jgi:hypothetical protein
MKIKVFREAPWGYDDLHDEFDSIEDLQKELPDLLDSVDGVCYISMKIEIENNPHNA